MNKEKFFQQNKLKTKNFKLNSGDNVELQELTAGQRGELQSIITKDHTRAQAQMITMSCPLFDKNDVDRILTMSGLLIERMANMIIELSGFGESAVEDAKKK